jgi:hypothetical protein
MVGVRPGSQRPDLWGPAAFALALILFIISKSPLWVGITGAALFLVLCHIVWHYSWVNEKLWRRSVGIILCAILVSLICRSALPDNATKVVFIESPVPSPSPLILLSSAVVDKQVQRRPNGATHIVFAIAFYFNSTGNTYAFRGFNTTTLAPVLDSVSMLRLFLTMQAINDEKFALSLNAITKQTIPPFYSGNTTTDSAPSTIRYLTPKQYDLFRTGKLAYYYIGTIQGVRGDAVYTVPYCGYGIYTFSDLVTHSCPYGVITQP